MKSEALEAVLNFWGYKLVEEAWCEDGRRTYVHSDDADRSFVEALGKSLSAEGWSSHPSILRAFHKKGEIIEIEIGGPDTSGHFLHCISACRVVAMKQDTPI